MQTGEGKARGENGGSDLRLLFLLGITGGDNHALADVPSGYAFAQLGDLAGGIGAQNVGKG